MYFSWIFIWSAALSKWCVKYSSSRNIETVSLIVNELPCICFQKQHANYHFVQVNTAVVLESQPPLPSLAIRVRYSFFQSKYPSAFSSLSSSARVSFVRGTAGGRAGPNSIPNATELSALATPISEPVERGKRCKHVKLQYEVFHQKWSLYSWWTK